MASKPAPRDNNFVPTALFEIDGSPGQVMPGQIDQATGRILVDGATIISTSLQTDTFTSTNGQTTFTASKTVVYTLYLSVNGSIQRPSTDYTVSGNNAVLANGIPAGNDVVWLYSIT